MEQFDSPTGSSRDHCFMYLVKHVPYNTMFLIWVYGTVGQQVHIETNVLCTHGYKEHWSIWNS